MGGFFGITSTRDCLGDVYFGVDYHNHLGTRRAGIAACDPEIGLQREIHNIENAPFRSKFSGIFESMRGCSAIGVISDYDPQPLLIRSNLGTYAICAIGRINNAETLIDQYTSFSGGHFNAMTGGRINGTELVAALINQKSSFAEGIRFAQKVVDGSASILILTEDGGIIAARDRLGRLPLLVGKNEEGYAVSTESFAYQKLGFADERELGPGEILLLQPDGITQLYGPGKDKRVCAFMWTYYGYPTSTYEGVTVETMRYRNGSLLARQDENNKLAEDVDYVGGVPDSGTPHGIGYAHYSRKPFVRAFIKYTPSWSRSFMPPSQKDRNHIAKMKLIPVRELIENKKLLFVDDSIVRGTQLRETVDFLYENGAREVHMRSACPPIMYGCKYLNFSRNTTDLDLIARQVILEQEGAEGFEHIAEYSDGSTGRGQTLRRVIAERLHLASLDFQSLDNLVEAIGLPECELCTYCWNGKE